MFGLPCISSKSINMKLEKPETKNQTSNDRHNNQLFNQEIRARFWTFLPLLDGSMYFKTKCVSYANVNHNIKQNYNVNNIVNIQLNPERAKYSKNLYKRTSGLSTFSG